MWIEANKEAAWHFRTTKPGHLPLCTWLRVAARLCVPVRFFWSGVDVALM
jgi:hypothetical protein